MSNIKVQELAKEIGKTSKDIMDYCNKKGIAVESDGVSTETAENIKKSLKSDAPKKKKAAFVFRPQNSSQPIPSKKKPSTKATGRQEKPVENKVAERQEMSGKEVIKEDIKEVKKQETETKVEKQEGKLTKPEGKTVETQIKETSKETTEKQETPKKEESPRRDQRQEGTQGGYQGQRQEGTQGGYQGQRRDGTQGGYQGQRREGTQGGYQGQRRDGTQGGYQGQRREGTQGGYQGQRRDGTQGGYQGQRREGTQGGYQGQRRDGTQGGYQGQRRDGTQGGYQGQRRDGTQGGYQGQRRDGGQGGYQGQRREGTQGGYQGQRREGTQGGYQGQRREGTQGGYQGQRREGTQGGYQGQRRDGTQGGYQGQRREGTQGGYQGQRRDGTQGGYQGQRRDGTQGGYQGQRRDGGQGGYQGQRRDGGQGGYQGQRRDGTQGGYQGQRRDNSNKFSSTELTPALSKNESRGGKPLNKKERELREKSKQYEAKSGKKQENTRSMTKLNSVKKPVSQKKEEAEDVVKTLILPESLTIKELAEKMKQQPSSLVKKLFLQGKMVTINSDIDFGMAEEIALEFNFICEKEVKVDVIEELLKEEEEQEKDMVSRPPVVCVMGHVDHGKTSLLDAIRSTNVIAREAGGITQHIGAYTVKCNGQDITFLDTPGHEAFTAMRMRGAKSTDIAILVVAADDGVMPQTVEAINHAKAAGVDIIVAINKIDKPSANIDRVKQEMAEYNLVPEDWGGDTIFVPVSAHTKEGLDTLLEMILLVSEVKELKANPNRRARGLVIEAQLDKGRGPVATVLVQKGTLHVGDAVAAGSCHGKVRAMIDDKGRKVKEAGPSTPVEILGLNDVPNAGEVLVSTENEKEARSFSETFISEGRERLLEDTKAKLTLDGLFSQIQAGSIKELNLVVKADVQGSVEAVRQSLEKLSNEEVAVKVIHGGVGAINESDVTLAAASNAIVIGFNVRPDVMAKSVAEREKVDLRLYRIIYQAIEDVEAAMKGMLDPVFEEKVTGHAIVRQIFKASGVGTIAGSYITDGVFQRGYSVRLFRGDEKLYEGALASLKRFKDDVKEVKEGYECGLVFEKFNDIKEEDTVEAYTMVEVPR